MPRILLNVTTLTKGGSLQVALNFLRRILADPQGIDWRFAISAKLHSEAMREGLSLPAETVVFPKSPARDHASRRLLRETADALAPDGVFTLFGPSYVEFAQPHLLGCNEPWVTHAGWDSYRCLNFPLAWLRGWALTRYKSYWFRRADLWWTESPTSRDGLCARLKIPANAIEIIPNSASALYDRFVERRAPFPSGDDAFRMLYFSAGYPHKNFAILPTIAAELRRRDPTFRFVFVLTLPQDDPEWTALKRLNARLGTGDYFENHGVVSPADGPGLYERCDCVVMPSLLETFSACYPEALAMGLPIVASDMDFAHAICGDAALYFPPRDACAAAERILRLRDDAALWDRLISAGKTRLRDFPDAAERMRMLLRVLRRLPAARTQASVVDAL